MLSLDPEALARRSETRRIELERVGEQKALQQIAAHEQLVEKVARQCLKQIPRLIRDTVRAGYRQARLLVASTTSAPVWSDAASLGDASKKLGRWVRPSLPVILDITSAREVAAVLRKLNDARPEGQKFPLVYIDRATREEAVQANGEEITHHGHEVAVDVSW